LIGLFLTLPSLKIETLKKISEAGTNIEAQVNLHFFGFQQQWNKNGYQGTTPKDFIHISNKIGVWKTLLRNF